jgi:Xaa-Pro aminopeptidase
VGLNLHEQPLMVAHSGLDQVIAPGNVLTVEPGLYYPERGLGMRLEDTLWLRPDGEKEVLADFPMDLVLPMQASRLRRSQPARPRPQETG